MELKIVKGSEAIASGLSEQIVEFDRRNMKLILEQAGLEFPAERRRRGLESNPTFIIAFDGEAMAGYLEYLRSWNNPAYIYVGSIQIAEAYRRTRLILELFERFRSLMAGEDFVGFETSVQKVNRQAVRMYQKIGFKLEKHPRHDASWVARAPKDLLETSPIIPLLDKWRARHNSQLASSED